jgi:hypothetical protein
MTTLTQRFDEAFKFAHDLHRTQERKAGAPYISHLMAVSALVLEMGGDEDQAIAALLHDAVEDQGGVETQDRIYNLFGARVHDIVMGCTDCVPVLGQKKPKWRERKQAYIDHLQGTAPEVLLVSLADKIHNAECTVQNVLHYGGTFFDKMGEGVRGTLWYYGGLADAFEARLGVHPPGAARLRRAVNQMQVLAEEMRPGLVKPGEPDPRD